MKAFVLQRFNIDQSNLNDAPEPIMEPQDILVKICAASINPLDKLIANGNFRSLLNYRLPLILGHDLSGVVIDVGSKVSKFKLGDEIFARPRDLRIGAFAERIALHEDDAALKPRSLTMEEAAALPLVSLASWQLFMEAFKISKGQEILIHAGAGGLGSTAIQLAHHLGATVSTTVRSTDIARARELGATHAIDYVKTDFSSQGARYDLVVDSLGGDNLLKSLAVLKPGGVAVSVVGPPDAAFASQLKRPLLKIPMFFLGLKMKLLAKKNHGSYRFFFMRADGEQLAHLAPLYDEKILVPVVDKVFAFNEIADAFKYLKSGKAKGKVVVSICDR